MPSSPCHQFDDQQLVHLSLTDSQYFLCLMQRYETKLTAYLNRFVYLPSEDIADIIQESFINTYRHLGDYNPKLKFSSWLYRIVHNQAVNFLKKSRLTRQINFDPEDDDFTSSLIAAVNIEQETVNQHFRRHVKTILQQLKPQYREVLVLKYFEDKDYHEISDILQKPMGTVATLISRAKHQFKQLYETNRF
ncbi:MAG TPA: sigma-70 family RNA polymerase sigma factor [Candidatus Woesebacteria bacterium]|jgi:RNA polymerase sigma-70 factor, ECF subfamily|nr:sigma-70 family RNA polymerase sigma factor [Candidatus Woesebacteria bacterium]